MSARRTRVYSGLLDSVTEISMSKMYLVVAEKADEILQVLEQDRHACCQEIAEALTINHITLGNHLKRAGYKKKLEIAEKAAEAFQHDQWALFQSYIFFLLKLFQEVEISYYRILKRIFSNL